MSYNNAFAIPFIVVSILFGFASSNLEQDKAECTNQLIGLATCLPYVGGNAKAPTIDCCGGVKDVVQKSMKCLCILIKDRNDPNLGFKINTTLALHLPGSCKAPTNFTKCIGLLQLQATSADAKLFSDFAHSLEHLNSTTPAISSDGKGDKDKSTSNPSVAHERSGGEKEQSLLKIELISGVLLWFLYALHAL